MTATRELAPSRVRSRARKDDYVQVRVTAEDKAILNRAASLKGQNLSEFVLESARREAEETILDQRMFFLDDERHKEFLRLLDNPSPVSDELRARMNRKAVWER